MTASISHGVQAIGLACIPIEDMPADSVALARKPVAAAVLTLRTRDDGHPELVATRLSDARDTEFPLPWLIDQALMPGMVKLISAEDRHVLAGDTMARRYFVEERLAALCRGTDVVDPGSLPDAGVSDEAALWKRLEIPFGRVDDRAVKRCWSRGAPGVAEDIALGTAVVRGRSMLPGLREGDLLLVRYGARVRPGDLVVARFVDGTLAVKRAVEPRALRDGRPGWWVLSDNPDEGVDSRHRGPVANESVLAVVRLRLWPSPRLGRRFRSP